MDRCPDCGALVADHAAPDPSKPAGSREWRGKGHSRPRLVGRPAWDSA